MMRHRPVFIVLLSILSVAVFQSHKQVAKLERRIGALHSSKDSPPSAQALRLICMGYDRLIADLYWLKFVNYVGNSADRVIDKYRMADRYLDVVTALDPSFVQPFWYCAFIVGSEQKRPYRAAQLLQRGIDANPDNWYLKYIAGINAYLYADDEITASRWYAAAANLPGAPRWLVSQSAILAARIPSKMKQIAVWASIYETEPSNMVREHARFKLIQLWSQVYSSSPRGPIREKARKALIGLQQPV